jgi:hypothetical protein
LYMRCASDTFASKVLERIPWSMNALRAGSGGMVEICRCNKEWQHKSWSMYIWTQFAWLIDVLYIWIENRG